MDNDSMEKYGFRFIAGELNNIGLLLYESSKFDEAIELYRDAMQVIVAQNTCLDSLQATEMRKHLNCWFEKLADKRATCSQLHLASRRDFEPNSPSYTSHGIPTWQHQRLPHVFSEALSINDHEALSLSDESTAFILLHNMAIAQMHKGRRQIAIELLEMALSETPKEIDVGSTTAIACIAVHYNLGLLHFQAGRTGKAVTMFADAVRLGKPLLGSHILVARTLGTVGLIMMKRGDVSYGTGLLEQASTTVHRQTVEAIGNKVRKDGKENKSNLLAAAA